MPNSPRTTQDAELDALWMLIHARWYIAHTAEANDDPTSASYMDTSSQHAWNLLRDAEIDLARRRTAPEVTR